jgi:hypothetical protein
MAHELHLINTESGRPKPELMEPRHSGYLYVAASVHPGVSPFVLPNSCRSRVIRRIKQVAPDLERIPDVTQVTVFRAVVRPPTARFSPYLKRRRRLRRADFDVMVLIETTSPEAACVVRKTPAFAQFLDCLYATTSSVYVMAARNVRRIDDVTLDRKGLFLFNHFAADDPGVMLELWDHLAGWYVAETGLRNSVALGPLEGERADYAIVNWAEWNVRPLRHFWHQLAKPSFWRYVAANLEANHAASMPVYCRMM